MTEFQKTVLICHSVEQMFDLISDIDDYPNFLPWCGGVKIQRQNENCVKAKIGINFKGIKLHFATYNIHQRPARIDMNFAEGPFRKFTGYWHFTALCADKCKIVFALHYEFSNIVLQKIIEPVFSHIANTFVESFVERAAQRYDTV